MGIDQLQLDRVEVTGLAKTDAFAWQQAPQVARVGELLIEQFHGKAELWRPRLAGQRCTAKLLHHAHADLVGLGALASFGVTEDRAGPGVTGLEVGSAGHRAGQHAGHAQHVRQPASGGARADLLDEAVPAFTQTALRLRKGAAEHHAQA
ncbi:MAG: hypothetical protein IPP87_03555 [Ideonella sp.]|nr:hypothetical protein [Ideonella sp.]